MLMKKNRKIAKRYLLLKGTDLYCYKDHNQFQLIFMHTLVGCFIEIYGTQTFNHDLVSIASFMRMGNPLSRGEAQLPSSLFKAVIKMSKSSKRVLYFESQDLRDQWMVTLRQAIGMEGRILDEVYRRGEKVLGRGAFGQVIEGEQIKFPRKKVAIKVIKKSGMTNDDLAAQQIELGILKACNHQNISKIIDVFEDSNYLYIVQEMIIGMDLCKYMIQGKRTEQENLKVMRKLFEGIDYMHSIGIVHRDIKLENIMIHQPTPEDPPIPKFIDFGLSTVLLVGESSSELYGTLAYCSPEIFLGLPYN